MIFQVLVHTKESHPFILVKSLSLQKSLVLIYPSSLLEQQKSPKINWFKTLRFHKPISISMIQLIQKDIGAIHLKETTFSTNLKFHYTTNSGKNLCILISLLNTKNLAQQTLQKTYIRPADSGQASDLNIKKTNKKQSNTSKKDVSIV